MSRISAEVILIMMGVDLLAVVTKLLFPDVVLIYRYCPVILAAHLTASLVCHYPIYRKDALSMLSCCCLINSEVQEDYRFGCNLLNIMLDESCNAVLSCQTFYFHL